MFNRTVLLSMHNICFGQEIRKLIFDYILFSGGLLLKSEVMIRCDCLSDRRLTLKAPITNAEDDNFCDIFANFGKK